MPFWFSKNLSRLMQNFYQLRAGTIFEGDWYNGKIPENIEVGDKYGAGFVILF